MIKKLGIGLLLGVLLSGSAFSQTVKHVLLVSIDGFRPDFYKDPSWPTPTLLRLKNEGVYADDVRSVFPSVTYPSHTTIVTGALPARHGIYYNVPYAEKNGHGYWEESYIKTTTLWDAVRKAGFTLGSVMWPVTVGTPIDYNFPVRRADNDESVNQLEVTLPFITPAGLIGDMQKNATGLLTAKNFSDHETDGSIGKMASYFLKTYKPNLMVVHFIGVDHAEHAVGREGEPVRHAIAVADSMVNVLVATIKEAGLENSTTIFIIGDHGFVNTRRTFSPNILLAQNGLLSTDEWLARFHPAGGSAFLYLKNKNGQATLGKVKEILNDLPQEQKSLFRIVDRQELDRIGANPHVALALAMTKGTIAGNEKPGELVKEKKKSGNHGYYPDFDEISTGFIAVGSGIVPHGEVKNDGHKRYGPADR
jgi:predicted AlkP superfamily pyrophosphatase or phosphodiesterase